MVKTVLFGGVIACAFIGGVLFGTTIATPEMMYPAGPYPDNDAVLAAIQADIPDWQTMDTFTLSIALMEWSAQHTLHGSPDLSMVYEPVQWDGFLYQHLNVFAKEQNGVYCAGYAHAYEEVLDLFGIPSYCIMAGAYPEYTHAAQLVEVPVNGSTKYIIIDPMFECYFTWTNGTPISWIEMVDEIENDRFSSFARVDSDTDGYPANFHTVMNSPVWGASKDQLLGDAPPRAIWAYEYSIKNNNGKALSRNFIRAEESR